MCDGNQYCCRAVFDKANCCDNSTELRTRVGGPGMPTASTRVVREKDSKIVAVGAGVGVSLGVLLAAALAGLLFMAKRERKLKLELGEFRNSPRYQPPQREEQTWTKPELGSKAVVRKGSAGSKAVREKKDSAVEVEG